MMKKLLALFCMLGLVFGLVSVASAIPYTTTLTLEGDAYYNSALEEPPFGEVHIDYTIDWWDTWPDYNTPYTWSLDVDVWASGFLRTVEGQECCFDEGFTGTFELGTFSIAQFEERIDPFYEEWIVDLEPVGDFGPFHYQLDLGWEDGSIWLEINEPIFRNIEVAGICFGGEIDLNAAPVPEPATMLLLGSGLVGIATFGRKKFKKK